VTDSEIQNLEWRVVEAAVKRRQFELTKDVPYEKFVEWEKGMEELERDETEAVDALIAAREKTEPNSWPRTYCVLCGDWFPLGHVDRSHTVFD